MNDDITVSRDALRAELAEQELRLRAFITEKLETKADGAFVASMDQRLSSIERQAVMREGPLMREMKEAEDRVDTRMTNFSDRLKRWERGELNNAQKLAYAALDFEQHQRRSDQNWSVREKLLALVGIALSLTGVFMTFTVVVHTW